MLSEASGLSKQQRAGGEKDAKVFVYYNTMLRPKKISLINILHNNGINSSFHWWGELIFIARKVLANLLHFSLQINSAWILLKEEKLRL